MTRFRKIPRDAGLILLINILVLAGFIYCFEFYLRWTDPYLKLPFDSNYYNENLPLYLGKVAIPEDAEQVLYTWGHRVAENQYHTRDKEFIIPKPDNVIRIAVFGDSFTWGAGLAEKQRYTNILDSTLNHVYPSESWEVLNLGASGGSTAKELKVLRSLKAVLQPDLIVVGFCLNDPQVMRQTYSVERTEFAKRNQPRLDTIKKRLRYFNLTYVGVFIQQSAYRLAEMRDDIPEWEEALDREYQKDSEGWRTFVNSLSDIKAVSDSLNCPPPVFAAFNQLGATVIPEEISSHNRNDKFFALRSGWFTQARAAAENLGFITIDYGPEFTNRLRDGRMKIEDLQLNELDIHPSAEMNKIYAELLFQVIRDQLIEKGKLQSVKSSGP